MLVSETPWFLASFDFPELFRQTQTDTSLLGILFDIYAEDLVLAACAPTSTKPRSVHGRVLSEHTSWRREEWLGAWVAFDSGWTTHRFQVMWIKTIINHPLGNGNHTTYKNCGLGDGLLLFYHVVPTWCFYFKGTYLPHFTWNGFKFGWPCPHLTTLHTLRFSISSVVFGRLIVRWQEGVDQ